jgi:hypothetical protein
LNVLVRRNNLRSAKFTFTPLDATTATEESQPRATPAPAQKLAGRIAQNVFPGIGISLTVEGSYANLRHFIRDVEASRQFVVINSTELEDVTESNGTREIVGAAAPPVATPEATPLVVPFRTRRRNGGAILTPPAAAPEAASPTSAPLTAGPPANRASFLSLRIDMAAYFRPANISAMDSGVMASGNTAR